MKEALLQLCLRAKRLNDIARDENGQDLIEYALLGCVVAAAIVAVSGPLQTAISTAFSALTSSINAA